MTRHIAQKIATAFVTIYVIITISFFLVHIMPGDPVIHLVGQEEYYYLLDNGPETLNKLIARYGLDDSLPVQYGKYLKNIVTLDFGPSYTNQKPVVSNVLRASKWTLFLSIPTWIIGGFLGALLGVIAGWKPGKLFDKIMTPVLLVVNTIPSNCLCLILLIFFCLSYEAVSHQRHGFAGSGRYGKGAEHFSAYVSSTDHHDPLPDLRRFHVDEKCSLSGTERGIYHDCRIEGTSFQKSVVPPCDEKCHGSLCNLFLYAVWRDSVRFYDHRGCFWMEGNGNDPVQCGIKPGFSDGTVLFPSVCGAGGFFQPDQ